MVLGLERAGRGHGDLDPAHAAADLGADLQELQTDGTAGGGGELGEPEPDPPERLEQDVGEGREPQPELVGAHGGGGGATGEQVELLLLDPVLDLAAGAVDVLVEGAGVDLGRAGSEVTTKRGFEPLGRCSALATTRRSRLQLSSVRQAKSAKRRAGRPWARLSAAASASSSAIAPTRRSLRARPKT